MKLCNPQPATTIRNQLFLNHVHNQTGFGEPFINRRGFIYLGISKMVFTLGKSGRVIFDYTRIILVAGSQMIKNLNLNVSDTNGVVGLTDYHLLETTFKSLLLLSIPGPTQDILLQEVLRNLRSGIDF